MQVCQRRQILFENVSEMHSCQLADLQDILLRTAKELRDAGIEGATTLLLVDYGDFNIEQWVDIAYLGNGSIIHMRGNAGMLPPGRDKVWAEPYRYTDLMVPHCDASGVLTHFVGPHAGYETVRPAHMRLRLDDPAGDILLLVTDGISSLEACPLLRDSTTRLWQSRSSLLQRLVVSILGWVASANPRSVSIDLDLQLESWLKTFREEDLLEDDASVAVLMTREVFSLTFGSA